MGDDCAIIAQPDKGNGASGAVNGWTYHTCPCSDFPLHNAWKVQDLSPSDGTKQVRADWTDVNKFTATMSRTDLLTYKRGPTYAFGVTSDMLTSFQLLMSTGDLKNGTTDVGPHSAKAVMMSSPQRLSEDIQFPYPPFDQPDFF